MSQQPTDINSTAATTKPVGLTVSKSLAEQCTKMLYTLLQSAQRVSDETLLPRFLVSLGDPVRNDVLAALQMIAIYDKFE
jgi:hypothetical protein